jgi:hypothetical protein
MPDTPPYLGRHRSSDDLGLNDSDGLGLVCSNLASVFDDHGGILIFFSGSTSRTVKIFFG